MKPKDEEMTSFCPRCGSPDIYLDPSIALIATREYYYRCRTCQYSAKLFPRAKPPDISKIQKELNWKGASSK